MTRSILDLNEERRNKKAKHSHFPIGSKVKIVIACRDFHYWYGETGRVIENKGVGSYMGVSVKLDKSRVYQGNEFTAGEWKLESFNFEPGDLRLIRPRKKNYLKRALKWLCHD